MHRTLPVGFVVAIGLSGTLIGQEPTSDVEHTPIAVEDLAGAKTLSTTNGVGVLSPDGTLHAAVVCDPRRVASDSTTIARTSKYQVLERSHIGCVIHITTVATGIARVVGDDADGTLSPAWSPNGRYLAVYVLRDGLVHLWVWDRSSEKVRKVSDTPVLRGRGYATDHNTGVWTPDSRKVLVALASDGPLPRREVSPLAGSKSNNFVDLTTVAVYRSGRLHGGEKITRESAGPIRNETPVGLSEKDLTDLALIDVMTGGIQRVAMRFMPRDANYTGFVTAKLSPDGRQVAFTAYSHVASAPEASEKQNLESNRRRLFVVDVEGGSPRVLAGGDSGRFIGALVWSPDSRWLAFAQQDLDDGLSWGEPYSLYVVEARTTRPGRRLVAPKKQHVLMSSGGSLQQQILWDSKSTRVAAVAHDGRKLWVGAVEEGIMTALATPDSMLTLLEMASSDNGRTFWSPDAGASMYVRYRNAESGGEGMMKFDLRTGQTRRLLEGQHALGPRHDMWEARSSADGQRIVFYRRSLTESEDLWIAAPDFADARRLTHLNPRLEGRFGTARQFAFKSDDGRVLKGLVLLPLNHKPGHRLPLIVYQYPTTMVGPHQLNNFGAVGANYRNLFLYTSRGYAVLWPSVRKFEVGTTVRFGRDILPAIDSLVAMGIADTDRIALMGASYGGYSTLSVLTQTKRFKAAVVWAAPADLGKKGSFDERTGECCYWQWLLNDYQGNLGAPRWEVPQRYMENSPINYVDRITTPVLIGAGVEDSRVPISNGDELFGALKKLGRDAIYLRYKGEGHGLNAFANQVHYSNQVLQFLGQHLQPAVP